MFSVNPVRELAAGMDYRKPEYRREVFLRFYEFHLKYRSHPGGVYFLMPYLASKFRWSVEDKLWYAFINGCTQHPMTSLIIFRHFPRPPGTDKELFELTGWFNAHWHNLPFDMDRRYQKKDFPSAVHCYTTLIRARGHGSQAEVLYNGFWPVWKLVREQFFSFGRLASFSYLEYLRIMGMPIECPTLFLTDLAGSKSHRNGLAKVLGRDDLDWHKSTAFVGKYEPGVLSWLDDQAQDLLLEAKQRFEGRNFYEDVGYFTLESTLCCYKSWYRKNRRYPNVYMDMMHDRIKAVEEKFPSEDMSVFWEARQRHLPQYLRQEDMPDDPGLCPAKQNHFRETGQVIMLGYDWDCFNDDRSWRKK